jgi:hypothetical protein
MSENNKERNNQLSSITSPNTIDYLASKIKEHNLGGIKVGITQPNGARVDLAV